MEMCLRLGSNINAENNDGETPIFNAIRGNQYHNVLVAINKFSPYHKNNDGETPFIVVTTFQVVI